MGKGRNDEGGGRKKDGNEEAGSWKKTGEDGWRREKGKRKKGAGGPNGRDERRGMWEMGCERGDVADVRSGRWVRWGWDMYGRGEREVGDGM